ncbi:tyrosine-type recombinase/integrase [Nonomuraea sp. NPDC023979]|uniref:tyrosine-type recombinase/integrase n=1 Tax=Nonomuraea sp. NPDC023979 TaxID=3154796 RepID=UPI0033ED1C38
MPYRALDMLASRGRTSTLAPRRGRRRPGPLDRNYLTTGSRTGGIPDRDRPNLRREQGSHDSLEGIRPTLSTTYRRALHRSLERCDIQDEYGRPVHLTPHQWRHTFGTMLINRDVPQEVVRRLLDHDSHLMTARYAPVAPLPTDPRLGSRPAWSRTQARSQRSPTPNWPATTSRTSFGTSSRTGCAGRDAP